MRLCENTISHPSVVKGAIIPFSGKLDFHRQKTIRMKNLRAFCRGSGVILYTLHLHYAALGHLACAGFADLTLSDSADIGGRPRWWSE